MTPFLETTLLCLAAASAVMIVTWLISLALRDASVADVAWGLTFVAIAWVAQGANRPATWRSVLLTALTTVWGLRLAGYLAWRRGGRHEEDHRYAKMRAAHGSRFWWVSLFTVFLLQAALAWVVSLPIQAAAAASASIVNGETINPWDYLGVTLWTIGLLFETIGDFQLVRFTADPGNKKRVMDRGLWGYTRHPNYFGDFCVWWGLFFIARSDIPIWTIIGPIVMSGLLLKVSGVGLLERDITERRPGYADYQRRVNAFFPWFPKSPGGEPTVAPKE